MGFQTVNPAINQMIKSYEYETSADVEKKITELQKNFSSYRLAQISEKLDLLAQIKQSFVTGAERLAQQVTLEMGKPLAESRLEVQKSIQAIDYYMNQGEVLLRTQNISGNYAQMSLRAQPLGLILGIMPWNFPVWQVFRLAIPNLILGNLILIKSSDQTAGVGELLEHLFQVKNHRLYFNLRVDHQQTADIIQNKNIAGVSLTGSARAGRVVAAQAGQALKKCVLELGGSDSYILWQDADIASAVKACAQSRLVNNGQSCVAAKRFFVPASSLDSFLEKLKKELSLYRLGDPTEAQTNLGPLSAMKFKAQFTEQVQGLKKFSSYWSESHSLSLLPEGLSAGAYVSPVMAVLENEPVDIHKEEIFGPCFQIFPYKDLQEVVQKVNQSCYGLGAAVFATDINRAQEWALKNLNVGMIAINTGVKSDPRVPFGGVKESGFGRELGELGLFEFANWQWVGWDQTAMKVNS